MSDEIPVIGPAIRSVESHSCGCVVTTYVNGSEDVRHCHGHCLYHAGMLLHEAGARELEGETGDQIRADVNRLRARCATLEKALSDAIETAQAYGPPQSCGDHCVYSPQIGERQVEVWKAALAKHSEDTET